jgi:hypothetical protein
MGIGGKCKDNINMADFEEYVALYVCKHVDIRERGLWA